MPIELKPLLFSEAVSSGFHKEKFNLETVNFDDHSIGDDTNLSLYTTALEEQIASSPFTNTGVNDDHLNTGVLKNYFLVLLKSRVRLSYIFVCCSIAGSKLASKYRTTR